jgi:hypothetical protein
MAQRLQCQHLIIRASADKSLMVNDVVPKVFIIKSEGEPSRPASGFELIFLQVRTIGKQLGCVRT